jgi:succinate dehydrogenase / fumarate reductase, cytochrome b subunit
MASRERPLSPHLQVYRWQITMVMSILHRATGVALAFGALLFAAWLGAIALGGEHAETMQGFFASWFGKLCLFGFSACLIYHLLNGIRHLVWDAGYGFGAQGDNDQVGRSGMITAVLAVIFTAIVWYFGLNTGGGQ